MRPTTENKKTSRPDLLTKLIRAAIKRAKAATPGAKMVCTLSFQRRRYPLTVNPDGEVIVFDRRGNRIVTVIMER